MSWNSKQRAIERGGAAIAATCLGAAIGFGIFSAAPLAGVMLAGAALLGGAAASAGAWVLLSRVDTARDEPAPGFAPVAFAAEKLDELLLDDPIAPAAPESRVVRLFGDQPLPDPGELSDRIDDYLDSGRGASRRVGEAPRADGSAALHAALADIRRSLG